MRRPRITKLRARGLLLLAETPPLVAYLDARGHGKVIPPHLLEERDAMQAAIRYCKEIDEWMRCKKAS